jgi:SagB-type dehydrogenase family enzyme
MLVCAARFPDLAVKYEGIAYALMVKHVGVLMATAAMAATAMGLGSVSIGTGNSDTFAAATGLDYYRHGSTGEIAISVPPEQGAG